MPVGRLANRGDLVIEGEMAVKQDAEVLCGVYGLYGSVWINRKRRIVKFGELSGIAKDKEFSLGRVE
jgi:hypothetical protein